MQQASAKVVAVSSMINSGGPSTVQVPPWRMVNPPPLTPK